MMDDAAVNRLGIAALGACVGSMLMHITHLYTDLPATNAPEGMGAVGVGMMAALIAILTLKLAIEGFDDE